MAKPYGSLTRLSDKRINNFGAALQNGIPMYEAIGLLGIRRESYHEAKKDFYKRHPELSEDADHEAIIEYADEYSKTEKPKPRDINILKLLAVEHGPARLEGELIHLQRINKAGADGDWRADSWWLERVVKQRYSPSQQMELSGAVANNVQITWGEDVLQQAMKQWQISGAGTPVLEGEVVEDGTSNAE
jgi:hypothetical protein